MHRTLKQETTRPPGMNTLQQQDRFDRFANAFNDERPHEALDMKMPAELYSPSSRRYDGLPDLDYAFQDRDVTVTNCGRICMHRKKINVSTALAGQNQGIKKVDDGIWLVSFIRYDLGSIDLEQRTLQTNDNPFGTRLSPMSQGAYSPRMAERGAGLRLQKKRESPASIWLCWAFWFPPWLHFAHELPLRQFRTATSCRGRSAMCRPDKARERIRATMVAGSKMGLQGAGDRRVRKRRAGDRGTGSMAADPV